MRFLIQERSAWAAAKDFKEEHMDCFCMVVGFEVLARSNVDFHCGCCRVVSEMILISSYSRKL